MLVSLIGSTACVMFSYVFPGLLTARCGDSRAVRVGGVSIVVLAAIIAVTTVIGTLTGHIAA